MDVGGGVGGGLVVAAEVVEADVVADRVEVGVDAEVVVADGALELRKSGGLDGNDAGSITYCKTTGSDVVAIDDLVWGRLDAVGRGEWDWEALSL